jgi:hypothetical protein
MTPIKDHYIRALEYAESRTTFTLEQLASELHLSDVHKGQLALQIHQNQIFNQNASDYINNYKERPIDLHFSVEDKFRLLNYVELQEARKSSRSATYFAVVALLVSIISLIFSACISIIQLNSPINIPLEFIEKIDGLSKEQIETKNAISDISRNILNIRPPKKVNERPAKQL